MILTDTHAHLYSEEFDGDRAAMVQRAVDARVRRLFLPNIDIASIEPMKQLVSRFPGYCFPMIGLHPCSVQQDYKEVLARIKSELESDTKYYAIGEIGIDLHWDKSTLPIQEEAFIEQCRWAVAHNLPVVIHSRQATYEIIRILKTFKDETPRGIFHCFTGSAEEAAEILKLGFHLGIGGVLTYKNSTLPEVLKDIDMKHLVLETDSPYLPPVPYRGKRNESAYVQLVAEKLAEVKGLTTEQVADITTQNSVRIFGI